MFNINIVQLNGGKICLYGRYVSYYSTCKIVGSCVRALNDS